MIELVDSKCKLKVLRNDSAKRFPLMSVKKKGDVGLDLPCTLDTIKAGGHLWWKHGDKEIVVLPFHRYLLPTGIKLEIPDGYWSSIEARSSTSKMMLIVPKGVIDEGYRGELFAQVLNVGLKRRKIHDGDRLVQLLIHKREIENIEIEETDKLSDSERGETGFGSTGRNVSVS